jgi:hypothetical protein
MPFLLLRHPWQAFLPAPTDPNLFSGSFRFNANGGY